MSVLGGTGELFKDLYSIDSSYDKYTRVGKVCIWQDTSAVNGSKLRINGLKFSVYNLADTNVPRTVTDQANCYGACTGLEECTDVRGEINRVDYWWSDDGVSTPNVIDHIKFTTHIGQEISMGTGEGSDPAFQYTH